jgi:hypothetical protein
MIRAALAAMLLAAPAGAASLSCPSVLRTTQDALDVPASMIAEEGPTDWSTLAYVEFYTGPAVPTGRDLNPVRYAVPPAEQVAQGRNLTATWDFSTAQNEVWLACHYHATRMYLLLPVPPAAVRCAVTWGRGESGAIMPSAVQRIECE